MGKRVLAVAVCFFLLAEACDNSTRSPAQPTPTTPATPTATGAVDSPVAPISNLAAEQVLRVDIHAEPQTLDPTLVGGGTFRPLHRGLVSLDRDLRVVPELAKSWDVSGDARTLTFHLRDARYSNGDPIVANDFVYSWRRLADPRTAATYAYVIAEVVGGPELLAMLGANPAPRDVDIEEALNNLGVSAPDEKTFVVRLNTPATYFLSAMTLGVFVPLQEDWITGPGATEAVNYVSSGPFILDTWEHNNRIVLKPNPYWWGDVKPTLTAIQMSMSNVPTRAQLAYEADELDMVWTPSAEVQRVRSDPVLSTEFHEVSQLAINFYTFNSFQDPKFARYTNPGPTADKDFRIALVQAIDKRTLIDVTYGGLGRIANSFIMPGIPGYQPDLDPYPYDLASARRHMATALAALGVTSATELGALKFGYPTGYDREPEVALLIEAWRQAFGLDIEQVGSDVSIFVDERAAGKYDISFTGWGADYPHANNQLSGPFTCRGGNNQGQYCNRAFDALLAKAAAEPDQDKQVAIYQEAQTLLFLDAPILPLRFFVTPYEVKPYVSGLTVTPVDFLVPGETFYETIQILKH